MKYVILGVTGPNEYENNVSNNFYTNYIARWCINYALEELEKVKTGYREDYERIVGYAKLKEAESIIKDLKQVLEMSTVNPARALGEEKRLGGLKPGMEADISILELVSGKWKFEDFEQRIIEVDKLLTPVVTIKAGQVIPTQLIAQPQSIN